MSSRGYGFLWNNPAVGRVELASNATRWVADQARQIDYWLTTAKSPAGIMAHYAEATGHAPAFPQWASWLWQRALPLHKIRPRADGLPGKADFGSCRSQSGNRPRQSDVALDRAHESGQDDQRLVPAGPETGGHGPELSGARAIAMTGASVHAVQRLAGNAAATRFVQRHGVSPGDAYAEAVSGATSALPHRERMEQAFGQSFADVAAHVGTAQAQRGLAHLDAVAASFGGSVAFAESSPGPRVVAHELAHVVQQRAGGSAVQAKPAGVSAPADRAEVAADRAADAVLRGDPVPDVGTADDAHLHRTTVNTNGGVFDNAPFYTPISGTGAVGERVGANIGVDFTAGDLVEAPANGIALIQTVKSVTDRVPGTTTLNPTRDQANTAVTTEPDEAGLVAANGAAIDISVHRPGRTDANNNPIYGVGFGAAAPSTSLSDGTPTLSRSQRGAHVRNAATGAFDPPVKAQMADGPGRFLEVAGQSFEMNFEIAALVTDGPMANTYLGSVLWGWQSDAAGTVTLKPFVALASGAPTGDFMQAATVWNNATFHDSAGTAVNTVDVPLTTLRSGVQAAVDMTTADTVARIPVVRGEITGLPAGPSVDRTNKEFELRALETEVAKRKINLSLTCNSISDTGGAAAPPEDEVWLALTGGGAMTIALTATRTFRNGGAHTYEFPVSDFLPLSAPLHIEVNEHDRAGTRSRAHDDVVLAFDWGPPFGPATHSDPDGHYTAQIGFNR